MKMTETHTAKFRQFCIVLSLMLLCSLQGCMYYYKVQTVSKVEQQDIKTYSSLNKYLILHQRDKAWHFSKPLISENTLYGTLSVLPKNHYKFQTTKPKGGNRYIKRKALNESYILEEVHLYVSDSLVPEKFDSGSIQIAFSKIQNAEVYVKATGRTNASWLVPAIGGPVLVIGATAIIVGTVGIIQGPIGLAH